tara:strand:- start:102480 stop:102695 length:216 start_codon:yes stop_codon:yes gene_type:complete
MTLMLKKGELYDESNLGAHRLDANPDELKDYLREFGAWSKEELKDHDENRLRLEWIVDGDISERGEFIFSH